jgi:hypothetical protein
MTTAYFKKINGEGSEVLTIAIAAHEKWHKNVK